MNTPVDENSTMTELHLSILRRAMEQIWNVLWNSDIDFPSMLEIAYIYDECKKARGK